MDQDRWKTVNRIFHAALEVDIAQRRDLVLAQADGDPEVQSEVELLLQADADAGSYLETPANLSEAISGRSLDIVAGDVLCDRFRIVREIAEGGMGRVFEAFDTELSVQVALKVIRPDIVSIPQAVSRFRQEVRLARSITHPHVCRTFDIERGIHVSHGQRTEIVFLTMEFLFGETLAARIKRNGALPLGEALTIARQIADALHAAHTLGVIHRDMKPANIMLVANEGVTQECPRAVITDFGLARLDPLFVAEGLSSFTNTDHPIGTLAYMAPEQLEGTAVSAATDIYAFGLILFEMVTGERAFPSNNLLTGIADRLHGSLRLRRIVAPEIPPNWHLTIDHCLSIRPSDRPQDAADVIATLERDRSQFYSFLGRPYGKSSLRLPRTFAILATFLLAVALLTTGLRLHLSKADSKVNPGALVYLTEVKNQSGEKSFNNLTELIRAGLSQSMQVNLLDQGRIGDILQQMTKSPVTMIDATMAREIAMRAGAVRVIFAKLTGSHGNYSLDVDIQKPDNTPTRYRDHWTKSFAWHESGPDHDSSTIPNEVLANVRSASDWIRHEVGESANDLARLDSPPEDVTTNNWEALEEYSDAERLARGSDREGAVNELKSALEKDPHFALADALLGDIEIELDHPKEGYGAYGKALEIDTQRRLSLRERDRIKGIVAHDNADYEAAEAAYREYTLYYPNDYLAWFRRGRPLLMLGRPDESAEVLKRAHAIDPGRAGIVIQIVRANLVRGDLSEVQRWLDEMRLRYSRDSFLYAQGPAQVVKGNYSGAAQSFAELSNSKDAAFSLAGIEMLAELRAEQGNYREAEDLLSARLRVTPANTVLLMDKAQIECKLGDYSACLSDLGQVLSKDDGPRKIISASAILGGEIFSAPRAKTGSLRTFLKSLEVPSAGPQHGLIFDLARYRLRGEILLTEGDAKAALAEFFRADALDAPFNARDYLVRALTRAAAQERDASKAREMRRKAKEYCAAIALHPATVWQFSPAYPPGFYADQLEACLHLSGGPPISEAETRAMLQSLSALRPEAAARLQNRRSGQLS
jgi:eukaryotic-like serine/threonine-protein kinase